jgi:hypothetical protein
MTPANTLSEQTALLTRLATHVMGWRIRELTSARTGETRVLADEYEDGIGCVATWGLTENCTVRKWNPLENLADAWMLLESVSKRTKWWELSRRPTGVCANFLGDPKANHYGATVCEAICLAADAFVSHTEPSR